MSATVLSSRSGPASGAAPRDRPILFSASMVRAILDGTKTQTRRVITPQPTQSLPHTQHVTDEFGIHHPAGWRWKNSFTADEVGGASAMLSLIWECRYGVVGDRLWVRETFSACRNGATHPKCVDYRADGNAAPDTLWKPSIFMPRALSRITLEVTEVRVQRVQYITDEDATAEGAVFAIAELDGRAYDTAEERWCRWTKRVDPVARAATARGAFASLWHTINGKRLGCAWADNPWVWCVSFRRLSP